MSLTITAPELQSYLENFARFEKSAVGRDLAWLRRLRKETAKIDRLIEEDFEQVEPEDRQ